MMAVLTWHPPLPKKLGSLLFEEGARLTCSRCGQQAPNLGTKARECI
jgi:hypothetical protein